MFDQIGTELALEEAKKRIAMLEAILHAVVCKKCGGMSWELPLAEYCQCESNPLTEPGASLQPAFEAPS